MTKANIQNLQFVSIFFIVLLASFFLVTNNPFYEDGHYILYLRSFLEDFDMNIINQSSTNSNWLVSKTYYDISQHSFVQTPFLLFTYVVEYFSNFFINNSGIYQYHPTSILLQYCALFVGGHYIKLSSKLFNLRYNNLDILVFLFSSSVFYFSFYRFNLIEIFTFPLLSYLLYAFLTFKHSQKCLPLASVAISISICLAIKPAYKLFCIYLAFLYLKNLYPERKKFVLFLVLTVSFYLLSQALWYQKYDLVPSTVEQFRYILRFEADVFLSKLPLLFSQKGLFAANPIFIFATIGFFQLLHFLSKEKTLSNFDIFILFSWMVGSYTQTFFTDMPIIDDGFVGRLNQTGLPILLLGNIYFFSKLKITKAPLYISILMISFFSTFYFLACETLGHHFYSSSSNIELINFQEGIQLYLSNISNQFQHTTSYIIYSFTFCFILFCFLSVRNIKSLRESYIIPGLFILTIFVYATSYIVSPYNITKMKKEGFYEGKAIVHGQQIYVLPYILDAGSTIYSLKQKDDKPAFEKRMIEYLDFIKGQVIVPNARLNYILNNGISNFLIDNKKPRD